MRYRIAASLLSADFSRLGEEIQTVIHAGADMIHFDVMDNHYVPNLTMGPLVCKAIRPYTTALIDVHLMVSPVDSLIPEFAHAGADIITFHPEATQHIDRSLNLIRAHGCLAGLAFNPATSLSYLDYVMDKMDLILLMSVNPGFGGQTFIPAALDKAREARVRIDTYYRLQSAQVPSPPCIDCNDLNKGTPSMEAKRSMPRKILLEMDGGIKAENIGAIAEAGVDIFVAGSAIFGQPDYHQAIHKMRQALSLY